MPWENHDYKLPTFTAHASLIDKQFYAVKQYTTEAECALADVAGGMILGILQGKPAAGDAAEICVTGVTKVMTGGAIALGAALEVDATGRVVALGTADLDTVTVKDLDAAASTGVAIFVVPESDGVHAHLESIGAHTADYLVALGSGAFVNVKYAAAPGGVALYFDEDGVNADERLLAVNALAHDLFITTTTGKMIRVKYSATAASLGVAVYGDDDAVIVAERLLFVSPTNADGTLKTDDQMSAVHSVAAANKVGMALEASTAAGQLIAMLMK